MKATGSNVILKEIKTREDVGGLSISSEDTNRAVVVEVGEDTCTIRKGDYVLLPSLDIMNQFIFEGETYYVCYENSIGVIFN